MLRALLLFCCISMVSLSESISCVTYYRYSDYEIGNCSGDACVTYITSESVTMMGCATNVIFSNRTGCYDDADGNAICSCQSDNCNNHTLDEPIHVDISPKISCFGHSASMCKGPACTVERIDNESYDKCGLLAPALSLVELQANLIVLEQTTKDGHNEVDNRYFKYLGIDFRANCITTKCVDLAQKLRAQGIKSKQRSVKCHSYELDTYNNQTCKGDFCYYQNVVGAVTRGCYTVDDRLAERKLSVGSYEYFYQRTYLCDEDFCNEDEAHARDNRSPRMGRSFTWKPYEMFEETTQEAKHCLSITLLAIMFSVRLLI